MDRADFDRRLDQLRADATGGGRWRDNIVKFFEDIAPYVCDDDPKTDDCPEPESPTTDPVASADPTGDGGTGSDEDDTVGTMPSPDPGTGPDPAPHNI